MADESKVTLRQANDGDGPFLERMLAIAADWRPGIQVRPTSEVMASPELARYISGWPRDDDFGYVAEESAHVGAAWWRHFTVDEPGYGFVEETIPEVSIGLIPEVRGRGIGTRLLEEIIEEARRLDLPALSLSVDKDNPAMDLYRRLGFVDLDPRETSLTMLLAL